MTHRPVWALLVARSAPLWAQHSCRSPSQILHYLLRGLQSGLDTDCWVHGSFTRATHWTDQKGGAEISLWLFLWVKHPGSPALGAEGKFFGNFRKVHRALIPWPHKPPAQLKKGENRHKSPMMNHCPYIRVTSRSCLPNYSAVSTPQVTQIACPGTGLDAWHF